MSVSEEQKQYLITVHGIRTYGRWQERLGGLLQKASENSSGKQFVARPYSYGIFTLLSFLVPFLRRIAVKRFSDELEALFENEKVDRVDIVAHSFGTYLVIEALANPRLKNRVHADTVILCGSVLAPERNLSRLIGPKGRVKRLINECGTNDGVLLLTLLVFGVGMAGRLGLHGLQGGSLTNRFFDVGHSGYFTDSHGSPNEFMEKWWIPILRDRDEPEPFDSRPEMPSIIHRIWSVLGENSPGLTVLIYTLPLAILASLFLSLWLKAVEQRDLAKEALFEAASNAASTAQVLAETQAPYQFAVTEAKSALEYAELSGADYSVSTLRTELIVAQLAAMRKFNRSLFELPGKYRTGYMAPSGDFIVAVDEVFRVWKWDLNSLTKQEISPESRHLRKRKPQISIGKLPIGDITVLSDSTGTTFFVEDKKIEHLPKNISYHRPYFFPNSNRILFTEVDHARILDVNTGEFSQNLVELARDSSHVEKFVVIDPSESYVLSRKSSETVISSIDSGDIIWSSSTLPNNLGFDDLVGDGLELFWWNNKAFLVAYREGTDSEKRQLALISINLDAPSKSEVTALLPFEDDTEGFITQFQNDGRLFVIRNRKGASGEGWIFDVESRFEPKLGFWLDHEISSSKGMNKDGLMGFLGNGELILGRMFKRDVFATKRVPIKSPLNADGSPNFFLAEKDAVMLHLRTGSIAIWRPSETPEWSRIPLDQSRARVQVERTESGHLLIAMGGLLYQLNKGHQDPRNIMRFPNGPCRLSPKGFRAVCHDHAKRELSLYDPERNLELDAYKVHDGFKLSSISFSEKSRAFGFWSGNVVKIASLIDGNETYVSDEISNEITSLDVGEGVNEVLVGLANSSVINLVVKEGSRFQNIWTGLKSIDKISLVDGRSQFIAASLRDRGPWTSRVRLFSLGPEGENFDFSLPEHSGNRFFDFDIIDAHIALMTIRENVYVWDLGKLEAPVYQLNNVSDGSALRFTDDNSEFWVMSKDEEFRLIDTKTGRQKIILGPEFSAHNNYVNRYEIIGTGSIFSFISIDGELVILDTETGNLTQSMRKVP